MNRWMLCGFFCCLAVPVYGDTAIGDRVVSGRDLPAPNLTRNRLPTEMEMLKNEVETLRTELNKEREERAALQKTIQGKIDGLAGVANLINARLTEKFREYDDRLETLSAFMQNYTHGFCGHTYVSAEEAGLDKLTSGPGPKYVIRVEMDCSQSKR